MRDEPGPLGVDRRAEAADDLAAGDTRNFSKFHFTSPASPSASAVCVELLVERVLWSPFTSTFSNSGNVTP